LNNTTHSKVLDRITALAETGQPVALVRLLRGAGDVQAVCAYDGALFPLISDRQLARHVLEAAEGVAARGIAADLLSVADEKGRRVTLAVEIIKPRIELLVFGGGHVGQAVALIGALTGYRVTVVDDREEFASRERLPDTRINLVVSDYATATQKVRVSQNTAVVIVTRGHQYDELCLKNLIGSSANYIGMIGSRKRVISVFKKLAAEGVPESAFERVHAPIGLAIGARSPQEIAVAIVGEIINHLNNPEQKHKGE
jgi:xanthine dehydrogenase accessory factor